MSALPIAPLAHAFEHWLAASASAPAPTGARRGPAGRGQVFVLQGGSALLDGARAASLIRSGVRAGRVGELIDLLGLHKKEDLGPALNANNTSLWRWEKDDKPLPSPSVEQLLRAMQLQLFATEVFGSVEAARRWLQQPHPALDGLAPSAYADNEFGAERVRGMLAGLKYGGVV